MGSAKAISCLLATVLLEAILTHAAGPPPWPYYSLAPDEGGAKCLDGSPYGFYVRKGANRARWVIEVSGGGWCYNEELCWERAAERGTGSKGSSIGWASNMTSFAGWGPSNLDPTANPEFWNASHAFLDYCDGASFSGYREAPWTVGDQPIGPSKRTPHNATVWFRGRANLEAAVRRLVTDHGLGLANEVVFTGGSAGGLTTFLQVDRVQAILGPKTKVVGLANAGFFKPEPDHQPEYPIDPSVNYTSQIAYLFAMQNVSGSLSTTCMAAQPAGKQYQCMLAPWAEPHVKSPLFVLQSKFDHFQLDAELGLRCMNPSTGGQPYAPPWLPASGPGGANCTPSDLVAIQDYGASFWEYIGPLAARDPASRGLFLTSCIVHGQTDPNAWGLTLVDGESPAVAFAAWWSGSASSTQRGGKWIENCTLPCNPNAKSCAPWH